MKYYSLCINTVFYRLSFSPSVYKHTVQTIYETLHDLLKRNNLCAFNVHMGLRVLYNMTS